MKVDFLIEDKSIPQSVLVEQNEENGIETIKAYSEKLQEAKNDSEIKD